MMSVRCHDRLQWGRGLSTAEGLPIFGRNIMPRVLQWGRGLSTAEGFRFTVVIAHPFLASMGPRSFNRGRYPTTLILVRDRSASMGPRSFNRGRRIILVFSGGRDVSFNGAAVFQPRKEAFRGRLTSNPDKLQWGRGLSTAEGFPLPVLPVLWYCFNGAAVFQRRFPQALIR